MPEIGQASFQEASVASAATCDIGASDEWKVAITGTTTITSFGSGTHRHRFVRFAGALTLTHNATSLILPGGANITTAAGDTCIAASDGSGNWRVYNYQRASGKAVVPPSASEVTGSKVVSFTREFDASSGNQAVTGVGFSPRGIMLLGYGPIGALGLGLGDSAGGASTVNIYASGSITANAAQIIRIFDSSGGNAQTATLNSLDSDGFTLAWTKAGSPASLTMTFYALCFR